MDREAFESLMDGVREMKAFQRGTLKGARVRTVKAPQVRRIRARFRLSQSDFAVMIGVPVATLRNWEQGRREPRGPARVLLRIIAHNPTAFLDCMREPSKKSAKRGRRAGQTATR
jgi:putative transcriptional regulator